MTDAFDEAIQEIAIKHGVFLSKDDPILILQTMNDRLIEESQQAQASMLAQFREEMASISLQWADTAKEKAERIMNATLAASKEAASSLLQESTSHLVDSVQHILSDSLADARTLSQKTKKIAWLMLVLSVMILITFCLFFIFM